MALNFPDNPTVGTMFGTWTHSWEWDGTSWNTVTSSLGVDDLVGVTLSYPLQGGQFLGYNGSAWENLTPAIDMDSLTDVAISAPVAKQVLSYNGTQWVNSTPADTGFNPFLLMGA